MKKIISAFAIAALALTTSCSNSNNPEGVAEKFVEANAKGNFDEAKKYADENTANMINMMSGVIPEAKKEEMKSKEVDVKIVSSDVKDSTAVVKYKVVEAGKESEEKSLDLKKVDDEWKVSINKEGAR